MTRGNKVWSRAHKEPVSPLTERSQTARSASASARLRRSARTRKRKPYDYLLKPVDLEMLDQILAPRPR